MDNNYYLLLTKAYRSWSLGKLKKLRSLFVPELLVQFMAEHQRPPFLFFLSGKDIINNVSKRVNIHNTLFFIVL